MMVKQEECKNPLISNLAIGPNEAVRRPKKGYTDQSKPGTLVSMQAAEQAASAGGHKGDGPHPALLSSVSERPGLF
jgi:hypothetical protein